MKKLTLFFAIVLLAATAINAQTVALHQASGSKLYNGSTAFKDACTAAVAGDTLYLSGNGFTADVTIDKKLVIYGAGHYPDSTTATGKTILTGSITLGANADGFHLEGVELTNSLISNSSATDGVIVKYCRIIGPISFPGNRTTPANNLMVSNCVLANIDLANATNAVLYNNIISGNIINSMGSVIENNISLFLPSYMSTYFSIHGNNNIIRNNVFVTTGSYSGNMIYGDANEVHNNIFTHATPYLGTSPTESGNYKGIPQADIFVNQSGTAFNYTHNYHLKSPATYTGTDGLQVGIYGGAFSYKEGAVPSNPHFISVTVSPQTDAQGKLSISIKAAAQDK